MATAAERKTIRVRREPTPRVGHRLPESAGRIRRAFHDHGLSIVLTAMFLLTLLGQIWSGWHTYNGERIDHGAPRVTLTAYLGTGHFGEATFENWESEFLQMAFYVLLTVFLYQVGSSESKRPDVLEAVDLDPRDSAAKDKAPWPVRKGGFVLILYENSLSLAFVFLFLASFALHAATGLEEFNQERMAHGDTATNVLGYLGSSQFWFESFQNWQSEFLSLATMVSFTIWLRQRGSPESKPVDAPIWETGN